MVTLVTGATGFVGSAVVRALHARGHRLRLLVRSTSDRSNIGAVPADIVEGDLRIPSSLPAAVAGCETLFHVAADYRLWTPRPADVYETNVKGTAALLEAALAAGVRRVVYTGSVGAMGLDPQGRAADEATPVSAQDPVGHYHRSKYLANEVVAGFVARGLPVVTVSPTMPVGPRDIKPTPTGRLILGAVTGRIPAYVETGLNIVHVDDVATGHALALERGVVGTNYILGGENITLRDLLVLVGRVCGRSSAPKRLPHAAVAPVAYLSEAIAWMFGGTPMATRDELRLARRRMYFSSARAEAALGYRARSAAEAVADAIAWFSRLGYCKGQQSPRFTAARPERSPAE